MDFSVLLADLRAVAEKYEGKKSDPQVSTLAYVDMFTKILRRAQKVTDNYDDQITVLWVALNQLASIYKDLMPGVARDSLCKFIFSMCARVVLNVQWSQLEEDSQIKQNFCATLSNANEMLTPLGFTRFQLIQELMESPWTHPILTQIMAGEDEPEGGLEYIEKEDPDVLRLRIEIMMKENCEEFALNLCEWSLKHPSLQNDLKIKEHQISILYNQEDYSKMQEVCSTIVCHDGIAVMSRLAKIPANQPLCIRLAQVFLIQDWIRVERTCCTQELLKLWIHHQYLADKDEERFLDSIWTVAKVCRNTAQIGVLIDGVRKECGDMFIQLYSELCKYAINIDKGNLEKEQQVQNWEEVSSRKVAISKTCVRMAFLFKEYDFRISRICGLTAFALVPTTENLNLVNKLYWTIKNTSATSENSKINPATIYELERLLGHLRPETLNPDYSWKQLIPLCKKYKQDHDRGLHGSGVVKVDTILTSSTNPSASDSDSKDSLNLAEEAKKAVKSMNKGPKRKKEIPKDIQRAHLEKMLLQNKDLSKEKVEQILSQQFPRHVDKDLKSGPPLTMKQLDKTINDLKQSIYLETQYREALEKNMFTLSNKPKEDNSACKVQTGHMSRMDSPGQPSTLQINRQHSAPASVGRRDLPPGLVKSPPHPLGLNLTSSTSGSESSGGYRQHHHTAHQQLPAKMQSQEPQPHGKSYLKSQTAAQGSQHSKQVADELYAKIRKEAGVQNKQKSRTTTHPNILRPPGTSQQECAKIAQYIAQLHEQQRAEKERLNRIRQQGYVDAARVALNTHNIPRKSQISDLLAMTLKGKNAQDSSTESQSNASPGVTNHVKPQETALPSTAAQKGVSGPPVNKFYVAKGCDLNKLKTNDSGSVSLDNSSTSVKPVFSMVVSKALTQPGQKEQLMKTVAAKIVKHKILPKPQGASVPQPVVSVHMSQNNMFQQQYTDTAPKFCNPVVQNSSLQHGAYLQSPSILVPSTVNTTQLQMQTNFSNVINQNQTPVLNSSGIQNLNTLANATLSVIGQVNDPQSQQPPPQPQQQQLMGVQAGLQPVQQLFVSSVQQNTPIIQQQEPVLATPLYTVSQPSYNPQAFMNTQELATTPVLVNQTSDLQQAQVPNILTVQQFPQQQQQQSAFGFEALTSGTTETTFQPPHSVGFHSPGAIQSVQPSQPKPTGTKPFVNAPELSPAVVRQILTSLKRTGAMAQSQKQETSVSYQSKTQTSKKSNQIPSIVTSLEDGGAKMSLKMQLQHVLKNKNDPNVRKSVLEAAQKIAQLRKEYSMAAGNSPVIPAQPSPVPVQKKPASLLQQMMEEDDNKVVNKQRPVPTSKAANTNIPDLPDLGSKEFQIDSILALDTSEEKADIRRPNVVSNNSEVLQVSSDQEMISHLQDFMGSSPEMGPSSETETSKTLAKNVKSTYLNANRIAKERESKCLQENAKRNLQSENVVSTCPKCKKQFRRVEELFVHIEKNECDVNSTEFKVTCGICKIQFNSIIALRDHVKMACCARPNVTTTKASALKDYEFTYVYKCSKCRFANVNREKVLSHVNTCSTKQLENHHDAELIVLFRCNMCGEVLPDKDATYRHVSRLCPQLRLINNQRDVQGVYDKLLMTNTAKNVQKSDMTQGSHLQRKAHAARKEQETSNLKPELVKKGVHQNQISTAGKVKYLENPNKEGQEPVEKKRESKHVTSSTEKVKGMNSISRKAADINDSVKRVPENSDVKTLSNVGSVPSMVKADSSKVDEIKKLQEQKRLTEKLYLEEFNAIEKRRKDIIKQQKEERERLAILKEADKKEELANTSTVESNDVSINKEEEIAVKIRTKELLNKEVNRQSNSQRLKEVVSCKAKAVTPKVNNRSSKESVIQEKSTKEQKKANDSKEKVEIVFTESSDEENDEADVDVQKAKTISFSMKTRSDRIRILNKSVLMQDARKRRGLRARSLIKKRKFLDELDVENANSKKEVPKELAKKPEKCDLEDDTKEPITYYECHQCNHKPWTNKYHIVKHYVMKHNYGFKADRLGYCCRYCRYKVAIKRTNDLKVHVLSHWKNLFPWKEVVESKLGLSPNKKNSRSPVKNDRAAKHLKALAMRNKCAENLKKIAIRRASAESETTQLDEDEEIERGRRSTRQITEQIELKNDNLSRQDVSKKILSSRKRSRSSSLSSRSSVPEMSSIVQHVKQRRSSKASSIQAFGSRETDTQSSQDETMPRTRSKKRDEEGTSSYGSDSYQSDSQESDNQNVRRRRLSARIRNQRSSTKGYLDKKEFVDSGEENEIKPRQTRSQKKTFQAKDEAASDSYQKEFIEEKRILRPKKVATDDKIQDGAKSRITTSSESSESTESSADELNISSNSLRSRNKSDSAQIGSQKVEEKKQEDESKLEGSKKKSPKAFMTKEAIVILEKTDDVRMKTSDEDNRMGRTVLLSPEEDFEAYPVDQSKSPAIEEKTADDGIEDQSNLESEIESELAHDNSVSNESSEENEQSETKPEGILSQSNFESVFQRFLNSNGNRKDTCDSDNGKIGAESGNFMDSFQSFIAEQTSQPGKRLTKKIKRSTVDKESDDTCDYDASIMLQTLSKQIEDMRAKYNLKQCVVKVERLKELKQTKLQERHSSPTNEIIIVEDSNESTDLQDKLDNIQQDRRTGNNIKLPSKNSQSTQQVNVEISPSKTLPLIFIAHDNNTVDIVQSCESPLDDSNLESIEMSKALPNLGEQFSKTFIDGQVLETGEMTRGSYDAEGDQDKLQRNTLEITASVCSDSDETKVTVIEEKSEESVDMSESHLDTHDATEATELYVNKKEKTLSDNTHQQEYDIADTDSTAPIVCTKTVENVNDKQTCEDPVVNVPVTDVSVINIDEEHSCSSSDSVIEITIDQFSSHVSEHLNTLKNSVNEEQQSSESCVVLKADNATGIVNEADVEMNLANDNITVVESEEANIQTETFYEQMLDTEEKEEMRDGETADEENELKEKYVDDDNEICENLQMHPDKNDDDVKGGTHLNFDNTMTARHQNVNEHDRTVSQDISNIDDMLMNMKEKVIEDSSNDFPTVSFPEKVVDEAENLIYSATEQEQTSQLEDTVSSVIRPVELCSDVTSNNHTIVGIVTDAAVEKNPEEPGNTKTVSESEKSAVEMNNEDFGNIKTIPESDKCAVEKRPEELCNIKTARKNDKSAIVEVLESNELRNSEDDQVHEYLQRGTMNDKMNSEEIFNVKNDVSDHENDVEQNEKIHADTADSGYLNTNTTDQSNEECDIDIVAEGMVVDDKQDQHQSDVFPTESKSQDEQDIQSELSSNHSNDVEDVSVHDLSLKSDDLSDPKMKDTDHLSGNIDEQQHVQTSVADTLTVKETTEPGEAAEATMISTYLDTTDKTQHCEDKAEKDIHTVDVSSEGSKIHEKQDVSNFYDAAGDILHINIFESQGSSQVLSTKIPHRETDVDVTEITPSAEDSVTSESSVKSSCSVPTERDTPSKQEQQSDETNQDKEKEDDVREPKNIPFNITDKSSIGDILKRMTAKNLAVESESESEISLIDQNDDTDNDNVQMEESVDKVEESLNGKVEGNTESQIMELFNENVGNSVQNESTEESMNKGDVLKLVDKDENLTEFSTSEIRDSNMADIDVSIGDEQEVLQSKAGLDNAEVEPNIVENNESTENKREEKKEEIEISSVSDVEIAADLTGRDLATAASNEPCVEPTVHDPALVSGMSALQHLQEYESTDSEEDPESVLNDQAENDCSDKVANPSDSPMQSICIDDSILSTECFKENQQSSVVSDAGLSQITSNKNGKVCAGTNVCENEAMKVTPVVVPTSYPETDATLEEDSGDKIEDSLTVQKSPSEIILDVEDVSGPSTDIDEPSSHVGKPNTDNEMFGTNDYMPSANVDIPSKDVDIPVANVNEQSPNIDKASTDEEERHYADDGRQTTYIDKSCADVDRPSDKVDEQSAYDNKANSDDERQRIDGRQITDADRPCTYIDMHDGDVKQILMFERPSAGKEMPFTDGDRQITDVDRPSRDVDKASTSEKIPCSDEDRQSAGESKPTSCADMASTFIHRQHTDVDKPSTDLEMFDTDADIDKRIERPNTGIDRPSANVDEQGTDVDEVNEEIHCTDDGRPSSNVGKPSADVDRAITEQEMQSTDAEWPCEDDDRHSTDVDRPSADVDKTSTNVDEPRNEVDKASTGDGQPCADEQRQNSDIDRNSADFEKPSAIVDDPRSDVDKTSTDEERQTVNVCEPTSCWDRPSTDIPNTDKDLPSIDEDMPKPSIDGSSMDMKMPNTDEDIKIPHSNEDESCTYEDRPINNVHRANSNEDMPTTAVDETQTDIDRQRTDVDRLSADRSETADVTESSNDSNLLQFRDNCVKLQVNSSLLSDESTGEYKQNLVHTETDQIVHYTTNPECASDVKENIVVQSKENEFKNIQFKADAIKHDSSSVDKLEEGTKADVDLIAIPPGIEDSNEFETNLSQVCENVQDNVKEEIFQDTTKKSNDEAKLSVKEDEKDQTTTAVGDVVTSITSGLSDNVIADGKEAYEDNKSDSKRSSRLRDRPKKDYKTISKGSSLKKSSNEDMSSDHDDPSKANQSSKSATTKATSSHGRSASRTGHKVPGMVEQAGKPAKTATSVTSPSHVRKSRTAVSQTVQPTSDSTQETIIRTRSRSGDGGGKKVSSVNDAAKSNSASNSVVKTVSPHRTRTKVHNQQAGSQTAKSAIPFKGEKKTNTSKRGKLGKDVDENVPSKKHKVDANNSQENEADKANVSNNTESLPELELESTGEEKAASEAFLRKMQSVRRRSAVQSYESDFSLDEDAKETKTNRETNKQVVRSKSDQVITKEEHKLPGGRSVVKRSQKAEAADAAELSPKSRSRSSSHIPSLSPEKATLSTMALKLAKKGEADLGETTKQSIKSSSLKKYSPRASKNKAPFKPLFRQPKTPAKLANSEEPTEKKPKLSDEVETDVNDSNNSEHGISKVESFRKLHKHNKPFQWESSPTRELRALSDSSLGKQRCQESIDGKQGSSNRHRDNGKSEGVGKKSKESESAKKTAVTSKSKDTEIDKVKCAKGSESVEVTKHRAVDLGHSAAGKGKDDVGKKTSIKSRSKETKQTTQTSGGKAAEKRKREKSTDSKRSRSRSKSQEVCDEKIAKSKLSKTSNNTENTKNPAKRDNQPSSDKGSKKDSGSVKPNMNEKRADKKSDDAKGAKASTWKEETSDKCKLDGTAGTPEKSSNEPCADCKLGIEVDCNKCAKLSQTKQSPISLRVSHSDSKRPAVRQIVHGGIVFEIQKGCVTETEIQKQSTSAALSPIKVPGASPSQNSRVRTRSTTTETPHTHKAAVNSPEGVVDMCMQGQTAVGKGGNMLNEYIHKTLDEIRRQRANSQEPSKWKMQKKSTTKAPKFPYAFKKRR